MQPISVGNKFTCNVCNSRFYDLGKAEAVCPKCGHTYVAPVPVVRTRRRSITTS